MVTTAIGVQESFQYVTADIVHTGANTHFKGFQIKIAVCSLFFAVPTDYAIYFCLYFAMNSYCNLAHSFFVPDLKVCRS